MSLAEHDEKYGQGGISFTRKIGQGTSKSQLIDSGLFGLNLAHGIGGVMTGAVIQLMGPPGVGKSSVSYRMAASGLTHGMSALIIDTEAGINEPILMDTLEDYGLDPLDPELPIRYATATDYSTINFNKGEIKPTAKRPVLTLERMLPMIEEFILDKELSPNGAVVVIDSLDFVIPESTVGSKVDDATVALVARRIKQWLRMFAGTIRGTGSLVIFVHQVSSKVDARAHDTETFFGGNAVKHSASLVVRFKDLGQDTTGTEITGRKVRAVIIKSKQGKSWRAFEYTTHHDVGPDNISAVFEAGLKLKVIKGTGWYTGPGIPVKMQGKDNIRTYWIENPSEFQIAHNAVLEAAMGNQEVADEFSEAVGDTEQEEYSAPFDGLD